MFEKVTKFRMVPSRRPASDVVVPANDNRRVSLRGHAQRPRAPRPICRWDLDESTNCPTCRWELDGSDEPKPSLQRPLLREREVHRTVLQLSYLMRPLAAAARCRLRPDEHVSSRTMERFANHGAVLHARH